MRRCLLLVVLLSSPFLALPAQTVELCDLAGGSGAFAAHNVQTPLSILSEVVVQSDWQVDDFQLVPTKDPRVRGNALAEVCHEPQCNCIFYDPAYLPIAPTPTADSWVAYYVLAHEAGHIIKPATGKPRIVKEAAADGWAGWAMEKINAPIEAVMAGVDRVSTSEGESTDYHSRCQRRMDALAGYNRAAALEHKPQYQSCNQCFAALSRGLYLTADAHRGAPVDPEVMANCGTAETQDVPTDFSRDLRGACLLADKKAGTQLTWDLVGICSR